MNYKTQILEKITKPKVRFLKKKWISGNTDKEQKDRNKFPNIGNIKGYVTTDITYSKKTIKSILNNFMVMNSQLRWNCSKLSKKITY